MNYAVTEQGKAKKTPHVTQETHSTLIHSTKNTRNIYAYSNFYCSLEWINNGCALACALAQFIYVHSFVYFFVFVL